MKTFALINPAAGGVTGDGEAKLRHVLDAAGLSTAAIETLDHGGSAEQMAEIAEMNPDLFIVWGGDGTLRSALAVVGQKCPNLLLLPGGTMNLLTKSIHGDHPWNQILANVVKSSRRVTLPAGQLNNERFYCAMLAGAPARFAEARESLRRGEIASVLTGARGALEALQTIHLKARVGEGYQCADDRLPVTSFIGAMVGPLVKNGRMEIAALVDTTATGALNVMWTSFLSDWRTATGVKVVESDTLIIDSEEDDNIPMILDGEAVEAGSRIEVTYVEEAAQCLTAA
jgi:diacylglycerol kinase family enzyme